MAMSDESVQIRFKNGDGSVYLDEFESETVVRALRFAGKAASEDDNARSAITVSEVADRIEDVIGDVGPGGDVDE